MDTINIIEYSAGYVNINGLLFARTQELAAQIFGYNKNCELHILRARARSEGVRGDFLLLLVRDAFYILSYLLVFIPKNVHNPENVKGILIL